MSTDGEQQYSGERGVSTKVRERKAPVTRLCRLRVMGAVVLKIELRKKRYLIGTSPDCDVVLTGDSEASRVHAELTHEDGLWCLRDLDSTNGIIALDAAGHETPRELLNFRGWQPGEGVLIGRTEVWLELVPTQDEVLRGFHGVVGRSPAMRVMFKQLERAAARRTTLLLTGESGTGKTMIAKAIHAASGRKGPCVVVNCGGLKSSEALKSELMGHVKGAFTGAQADRAGAFRTANSGTLFLDEIAEIPLELQAELLRVVEELRVKPMGSDQEVEVDVRLVVATHRNLARMVAQERFRADLYYRLNVMPIHVPPLSERFDDLPDLLDSLTEQLKHPRVEWPMDVVKKLASRETPGNVRELKNLVERILIEADGAKVITLKHLEPLEAGAAAVAGGPLVLDIQGMTMEQIEEQVFSRLLQVHKGNASEVKRILDVGQSKAMRMRAKLWK
jgi:DNA-binding NtrC family response regulator